MRILLLIILFFGSCADKETSSQTKSESQLESVSLEMTAETNINKVNETTPEPILVSYDKGLDLILVETSFENTIYRILDNGEESLDYEAIYWDSNNNQYYTIENDITLIYPIPTTNTNFIYNLDESNQLEPVFDESLREIFPDTKAPLLYIGSISPLERLYLDPTNQQYYIKKLQF
ncbi:MAG: hypothetical protein ACRCV0_04525, partial [Brevinema sp.]